MKDRRPGMYYVPNEGMRYWDGESWSESEPGAVRSEAAVTADQATAHRRGGGNRVLPWAVAGIALIVASVMATLLVVGGGAGTALASASEAITALVSPPPTTTADAAASAPAAPATKKPSRSPSTTAASPRPAAPATKKPRRSPSSAAAPPRPAAPATKKPHRSPSSAAAAPPPPPPASAKPALPEAPEPADSFDNEYAREIARRIVRDIASGDERVLDGIRADSAMAFLSKDMGHLEEAGLPDVKDQAHYVALVRTLGQFYDKAEWQLQDDEITEAAATYTVAREATSELLNILNPVLGTQHELPAWSWM